MQGAHRCGQSGELLLPLGIHHHRGIALEPTQTLDQQRQACCAGGIKLPAADALHGRRGNGPITFLLQPAGQITAAETEQPVLSKRRGVHRFPVEEMHAVHGGAAPFQERRNMERGIKGPEGRLQHLRLQHPMTAQGRIPTTHQQHLITRQSLPLQRLIQGHRNTAVAFRGIRGHQRPGVGQQKQQGRRMAQPPAQGVDIPAQQQRAAVHRLRAGGIVVNDHNLHGTIVP